MKRTKKEVLARRLKTTALAAGAALVGAGVADGAIMGEHINKTVAPNTSFDLDLDGDGNDDFTFSGTSFTTQTGYSTATPSGGSTFVTTSTFTYGFARASAAQPENGVFVSSGSFARTFSDSESVSVSGPGTQASAAQLTTSFGTGPFAGSTPRFLGLRFNTTDFGMFNGWARVAVPSIGEIYIQDYAFESNGGAIHIDEDAQPIPEPGTLLLMASGAAGLLALRRRRKS